MTSPENRGWELRVRGFLFVRPDGRINSSPIVLTSSHIGLQQNCGNTIQLDSEHT